MCFTFKKNNKQTKKLVNRFLQDNASVGIRSPQTSIEIKLPKSMERTLVFDTSEVILRKKRNRWRNFFPALKMQFGRFY